MPKPPVTYADTGQQQGWIEDGLYHRLDGPAYMDSHTTFDRQDATLMQWIRGGRKIFQVYDFNGPVKEKM